MSYDFESSGANQYGLVTSTMFTAYPFTIAAWIKPESFFDNGTFFAASKAGDPTPLIQVRFTSSGTIQGLHRQASGISNGTGATTISTGSWSHVVYVCVRNSHQLYINGTAQTAETTDLGDFASANGDDLAKIAIGVFNDASDTKSNYYDGKLAYVTVWNTNLSSGNVSSLYNGGSGANPTSVANANITHNWPLTADANDTVGSANFTITGASLDTGDNPFSAGSISIGGSAITCGSGSQVPSISVSL